MRLDKDSADYFKSLAEKSGKPSAWGLGFGNYEAEASPF